MSRKLLIASILTALFVVVELLAGWYAHSLALIGDAFHNVTDALALIIALIAVRLEQRPATEEKSFGYQRAGILAAFVNAGTLV
ncbi:MAG: cation diffusion facilitator family transporter, partial [Thermoanaerobaculia bacterium]